MNRRQFVEKCFQRAEALRTTEPLYRSLVSQLFQWLLLCDQAEADQTTQALGIQGQVSASVRARQAGVVAGVEEVLLLLGQYPGVAVGQYCRDGSRIEAGEALLTFSLDAATLLRLERIVLNVLGRMSGIATQTQRLVRQASNAVSVAATRKTPWMLLDKKAVACGGGLTHRLNLADAILIKDNHLIAFQRQQGLEDPEQIIREVVLRALAAPGACFELEVEGRRQAMAALSTFEQETAKNASATPPAMILMLDNFKPPDARALVEQIRAMAVYERVLVEASGDITEATLPQWAATGVDVVSLGALTHSTRSFNLSLEIH